MSFPPYTAGWDKEDGGSTGTEQEITRKKSDLGEVLTKEKGDGNRVRGEDGAKRSCQDAGEAEDECDEIAFPEWPIQWIIGIVGWLGDLEIS